MSGNTGRLADIVTSAAPLAVNGNAGFRRAFRDIAKILFNHQYVCQDIGDLTDEECEIYHVIIPAR